MLSEENLQKCFCLFIRNNSFDSVTIDVDRFKSLLGLSSKFTDKQWIMIIKSIDKNGDGQIEFDEFKDMMDLFLSP